MEHPLDTTNHRIYIEILKLVASVAWADREVDELEVARTLELARLAGASPTEIDGIQELLADGASLPGVDLSLLRANRAEVMRIVDLIIDADGRVAGGETAARAAINQLLDERP